MKETKRLITPPGKEIDEHSWNHLKSLFGSWVEGGDEDKQLEDLYRSRLVPSSIPDTGERDP